jgi:hypothetical protein
MQSNQTLLKRTTLVPISSDTKRRKACRNIPLYPGGHIENPNTLADPEDRSRERREDHVGLLKLEMPANVVQDSDGANQSDMIHNPTLSGKKHTDRRIKPRLVIMKALGVVPMAPAFGWD